MKKTSFFLFQSLVCFTLVPKLLLSLPKEPSLEAGSATVHHKNSETMVITTSDRAILDYKSFDIDKGEKVQFIQPSSSATVLNRVKGGKESKILGNLESNGKVFLVNPSGIYFGKESMVNVGSLIASTLDITNENFMKDQFSFFLQDKNNRSEIRNEGFLSASPEGAIVLMAPIIRNLGVIKANAGKVVLAAGEKITLDFTGDGLLEFSVEGELKDAVIEHLGSIKAAMGEVALKLPFAKRAIHEVVNHEGVERGEVFVMEEGVISLVSASSILAKKVEVEAHQVDMAGVVDVSSAKDLGGEVFVFGEDIHLVGAKIDATGALGGGKVLIGGEYQGKGQSPQANRVLVDESSLILASAVERGDGGLVVLWSQKQTTFNGKVFSQGGAEGGNGGVVESSSKGRLVIESPYVNTLASHGHVGQWLLDPSIIRVMSSGGVVIPAGCPTGTTTITPATIESQPTTVTLCAGIIMQEASLVMSTPGVGLSFVAPADDVGVLLLDGSITTRGGPVTISNFVTTTLQSVTIDTTNAGGSPAGADITFGNMDTDGVSSSLSFIAGLDGVVTFGDLGLRDRFGHVTVQAKEAVIKSIFTKSLSIIIDCPVTLQGNAILDTALGVGGNIVLGTVDASSAGVETLAMDVGEVGIITVGTIGSIVPLGNVTVLNGLEVVPGDITTKSGDINIKASVRLSQDLTTWQILNNSTEAFIFSGTINGTSSNGQSLTVITEKRGGIALGRVGEVFPLNVVAIQGDRQIVVDIVKASSMQIQGLSETVFTRDIVLTGTEGLTVNSFAILLNGHTFVEKLSLVSFASILSASPLQLITVTAGSVLMDSIIGDIGTQAQAVAINTTRPIVIGASFLANLQGVPNHQAASIKYVPNHTPCIVKFNTSTILNCQLPSVTRVEKQLTFPFFRTTGFVSARLGIGYNPLPYENHAIHSYFGNIFEMSPELGGSSYYRFMGL